MVSKHQLRRKQPRVKEALFQAAADTIPLPVIETLLRRTLHGRHVAIVVHRVLNTKRPTDPDGETTIVPLELDRYVESMRRAVGPGALTITFDDGYADACEYVQSRAPRFPDVRWLFFVCPQKLVTRSGFRWDEFEEQVRHGVADPAGPDPFVETPGNIDNENTRAGLRGLGDRPEYRLATVDACRKLAALPNVELGNHSNCHFILSRLAPADARRELTTSTADFRDLFGECHHFAFAFGVAGCHFDTSHVQHLASLGQPTLWTVDERPFFPSRSDPGRLTPRMVFNGCYNARRMLLWTAWRAAKTPN